MKRWLCHYACGGDAAQGHVTELSRQAYLHAIRSAIRIHSASVAVADCVGMDIVSYETISTRIQSLQVAPITLRLRNPTLPVGRTYISFSDFV